MSPSEEKSNSLRVWNKASKSPEKKLALSLYAGQLGLNLLWTILFFGLQRVDLALGEVFALWAAIAATLGSFFQIDAIAGWLLVPYQLWTTFAAALNTSIWFLNNGREQE